MGWGGVGQAGRKGYKFGQAENKPGWGRREGKDVSGGREEERFKKRRVSEEGGEASPPLPFYVRALHPSNFRILLLGKFRESGIG